MAGSGNISLGIQTSLQFVIQVVSLNRDQPARCSFGCRQGSGWGAKGSQQGPSQLLHNSALKEPIKIPVSYIGIFDADLDFRSIHWQTQTFHCCNLCFTQQLYTQYRTQLETAWCLHVNELGQILIPETGCGISVI